MDLPSGRKFTFLVQVEHLVLDLVLVQQRSPGGSFLLVAWEIVVMLVTNCEAERKDEDQEDASTQNSVNANSWGGQMLFLLCLN